jgi:hypothetical protein
MQSKGRHVPYNLINSTPLIHVTDRHIVNVFFSEEKSFCADTWNLFYWRRFLRFYIQIVSQVTINMNAIHSIATTTDLKHVETIQHESPVITVIRYYLRYNIQCESIPWSGLQEFTRHVVWLSRLLPSLFSEVRQASAECESINKRQSVIIVHDTNWLAVSSSKEFGTAVRVSPIVSQGSITIVPRDLIPYSTRTRW